jgi:putative hydrolases of HD superfamily
MDLPADIATDRLPGQLAFLREIDKIKGVFRLTYLLDASRRENDAEHSWELALMAMVLAEYGPEGMDLTRVVKMVLIHDLVEIDAGDVSVYDTQARQAKQTQEAACAERLFSMLPEDQGGEFRRLWEEFEARKSPEARFAKAMDRLQPLLHNCLTRGKAWREHGTDVSDVLRINRQVISEASEPLWSFANAMITQAVQQGYLNGNLAESPK